MNENLGTWLVENVMGWKISCAGDELYDRASHYKCLAEAWDPLANDAQAMIVLDRMIELGWEMSANRDFAGGAISCEFGRPGSLGRVWGRERLGETTREALCNAAKAAIEAERAQEKRKHTCEETRMYDLRVWLAENVMGYVRGSHCGVSGWHSKSGRLFIADGKWDPWIYGERAEAILNAMLDRGWKCEVGKNSQVTLTKGTMRATNDHNCSYAVALGYAAKAAIEAERAQEKKPHTCKDMPEGTEWAIDPSRTCTWCLLKRSHVSHVGSTHCGFCGKPLDA